MVGGFPLTGTGVREVPDYNLAPARIDAQGFEDAEDFLTDSRDESPKATPKVHQGQCWHLSLKARALNIQWPYVMG